MNDEKIREAFEQAMTIIGFIRASSFPNPSPPFAQITARLYRSWKGGSEKNRNPIIEALVTNFNAIRRTLD